MVVEFRLLGDVVALVDGCPVEIGHARQRCVLVALLMDANCAMPADQLIDRVWADRIPQRARAALQGYLSRLRQVLASAPDVQIVHRPGGYLLSVDPAALDVHRFQCLIGDAKTCEEPRKAVDLYEQALGLWRGEAFATLDTPWLNSVRASLDATRFAAELDRNDAALAAGRHAALLVGLSEGAAAHPLDERLAAQLMLALYRCGRQPEALEHFQRVRARLVEELAVDPSPPLQRLHQRILAGDPAVAPPDRLESLQPIPEPAVRSGGARSQPAAKLVPAQLPSAVAGFVGRSECLRRLDDLVANDEQPSAVVISVVSGTAGVGKTALAVHWAHQVRDRFPDGQLYVNLRGFDPSGQVVDPAEAIRGFLDALGVVPQRIPLDLDAQTALYRSLLDGKRILVMLDNARDTDQIRPLLPGSAGCLAIVTSRNDLASLVVAHGTHPITLDLLIPAEARELLSHRLGPGPIAAEPDAVDDIIQSCARLPLALAIVAARAAAHSSFPLHALATELSNQRSSLDAFDRTDPHIDVRTVFSWSYTQLSAEARRLFRLLGLHPGPDISAPAAASLAGITPRQVHAPLSELTDSHLVNERTPGRYGFHDLLRAYAVELAEAHDTQAERRAARHRMLDHYLHTAHTAERLLDPYRDPLNLAPHSTGVEPEQLAGRNQAMEWFTTEHAVLLAVLELAAATGFNVHVWQLAWTLNTFLYRRGHWHDRAATWRSALNATRRLGDRSAQALAHRLFGRAHGRLGRFADADTNVEHALDLYSGLGDRTGQAHTHYQLGWMCGRQGRHVEALDHSQRALELYQAVGHVAGQGLALNEIGWNHSHLGQHHLALSSGKHALTLFQKLGDGEGEAATWDTLGYAHHHLRQYEDAATCYQHALNLCRQLGDRYHEAATLGRLGDTQHAAADPCAAYQSWRQALEILDAFEHPDADQIRVKLANLWLQE
jgi:DNA-binding SARP family transcriptional activator/Flp pilus assembly protein TadD